MNKDVQHSFRESRFEDTYELGRKSFGRTELAELRMCTNKDSQEVHAVKMYRKSDLTEAQIVEARKEFAIFQLFDHPNIAKVLEAYEDKWRIYYLMAPIRGGSLFEAVISQGAFTEEQTALALNSLLSILAYLHGLGYIHRNLRPEVLGIVSEQREEGPFLDLILFDMVSVRLEKELPSSEPMEPFCKAFPFFRPPEYFAKPREYSFKFDVWSLGCLVYNMLTGTPPFYEELQTVLLEKIKCGVRSSVNYAEFEFNFPPDTVAFVEALLQTNWRERPHVQEIVRHPWFRKQREKEPALPRKQALDASMNMKSFHLTH